MKFCEEDGCGNMLYSVEDKNAKRLMYKCYTCDYEEPADNNCVYSHTVAKEESEGPVVLSDVVSDPTLPRTKINCPKCGPSEAVYFQAPISETDRKIKLYFACCNPECLHRWIK